jgi:NAD kinase
MIVFVEHSVMEDTMLTSNSGFMEIREKLKSFQDGKDDLTDKIDFIICLGGDGTLLYASLLFQVRHVNTLFCNVFTIVFMFRNLYHQLWRSIWVHLDF